MPDYPNPSTMYLIVLRDETADRVCDRCLMFAVADFEGTPYTLAPIPASSSPCGWCGGALEGARGLRLVVGE